MDEQLCQQLDIICKQELFNYVWGNDETGEIELGSIADDVIEITGVLKTDVKRTTFRVIVNHNDLAADVQFEMNPVMMDLVGLFPSVVLDGSVLKLNYSVPNDGYLLKIKGIKKTYKL